MSEPAANRTIDESDLQWITALKREIAKVVIGQEALVNRLILGLLTNGHVLLEGVPGLAKTLTVKTLAACISAKFSRIQFTPDLLPSDVVGTVVYNPQKGEFFPKKGPVFAHILLADEINRAPAKVQSALLECMQEHQVTLGDASFSIEDPFLVLATENPIDQEGTYPLPEAQIDRFMFKVKIGYPSLQEEKVIMEMMSRNVRQSDLQVVTDPAGILNTREKVDQVYMDERIKDYILSLVRSTRNPGAFGLDLDQYIQFGASPRATIFMAMAAKAHAFIRGKGYVTPQDVKEIGPDILRHRIVLNYEAEAEEITTEDVIGMVFQKVAIP
ncbi:MAG: MoxR family ATPase [Opitutales bacterium]|nr:MoxR family ATPase [Opitutales bacterium]